MPRTITALLAALLAVRAGAAPVFVEAEAFDARGGWSVDQQFMDQMGSPYLIAHGLGRPVADAVTKVKVPAKGEYRVFVRTRDWTARWTKGSAGRFRVAVNGVELEKDLGVSGDEWKWEEAGRVKLEVGEATLALRDRTGFDGRCDAIALVPGAGAPPPSEVAALERYRRSVKAIRPAGAPVEADLVVVGGGIAGTCAAISAARLGLSVAFIHDRPVLGGCNSSEVRVHLGGRINIGPYPHLGDVVAEIGPARAGNAKGPEIYEDGRKAAAVASEKNIRFFPNHHVTVVETFSGRIESVRARDIVTGVETRFVAPLFVDATGDGNVGAAAGAEFRYGRESKEQTGEETAVETADRQTMGASVQWRSRECDAPVDFPKIEWALPSFVSGAAEKVKMGEWTWETGMTLDQVDDAEHVRDYGMLVVYSNWNYLKNLSWERTRAEYAKSELEWVAYVAGKRESRRLVGDLVLCEQDIREMKEYPDGTACTSWTIDLHYPDPKNAEKFPEGPFKSVARHIMTHYYPIPYRCLYSKNISNLFMAGRDISVTHVALGTARVMRTGGMLGEVVGMAASVCKKHSCPPRAVYEKHLDELKELMSKGVGKGGTNPPQNYNNGANLDAK